MQVTDSLKRVADEVSRVMVGKRDIIEMLLVALLSEGHVLLEGVPGVAKTTMAKTFSQAVGGTFKRIQMTPDLLPADVLGVNVYSPADGKFSLRKGPVFANVVMADELNRASPKVQSALLEVMQERQVTIEGVTMPFAKPFMVIGTQVPYGGVGTYPLSDVQSDRFGFKISVGVPTTEEEMEIIARINDIEETEVKRILEPKDAVELIARTREIYVSDEVRKYIVDLMNKIRSTEDIKLKPGPRGSIWLYKASRARALLQGRNYVIPDDVKFTALYVLEHRIQIREELGAEAQTSREIVEQALTSTPVPKG